MQMDGQNHILIRLAEEKVRLPMVLSALVTGRAEERNTQKFCEMQRCTRCEEETACQWRAAQTPPRSQRRALPKRTAPTEKPSRIPHIQEQGPYGIALDNSGAFTPAINSNHMIGGAYASSSSSTSFAPSSCAITAFTVPESTKRTP